MRLSSVLSADVAAGIFLGGLGLYIIAQAQQWTYYSPDGPGPGFFPFWYGMGIAILAGMLIVSRIRADRNDGADPQPGGFVGRAFATWAAFAATIFLLEPLGFALSFGLLTLVLVRFILEASWRSALQIAVLGSLGFELIFPLALGVALPVGLLGFS